MASRHVLTRLIAFAVLASGLAAGAPAAITLAEASRRVPPDLGPAHDGQQAEVSGVVAGKALKIRDYHHLPLQDESGYGLMIESSDDRLEQWQPGDRLRIAGTIGTRFGMVVLRAESTARTGEGPAPQPRAVKIPDLLSPRYLGMLVSLDATVIAPGDNAGGDVLAVGGSRDGTIRVFLPREQNRTVSAFSGYHTGDRVRIIGYGSQYCPVPPYNRLYQILVGGTSAVTLLERGWFVSPDWLLAALLAVLAAFGVWLHRERVSLRQRRGMRELMNLAEDVVSSSTPTEIARAVSGQLPQVLKATEAYLYLYNRVNQTLDPVQVDGSQAQPINIQSELGGLASAVALTFRNRAMLEVPDTRNSPLFKADEPELPSAAVFVPMLSHQEILGVLMMTFSHHRQLGKDEQAAVQHVANQIATSLKLQEQKVMREQLLRSEKMAASGQLISGIATELRVPLQAVKTLADDLLGRAGGIYPDPEMQGIAFEADRAVGILSRLVSFATTEAAQSQPVNLNEVLEALMEFRRREWTVKGLGVELQLPETPLMVLGAQSQLEQVLLNVVMQAESYLDGKPERKIRIGARRNADDALIDIVFSDVGEAAAKETVDEAAKSGVLGLQVCQAILQTHGGEVKLSPAPPLNSRFEIRLPAYETEENLAERQRRAAPARPLTALIVETDVAVQRRLMTLLSRRGHRSIPVASAEDGVDLSRRMRFDVVFCAVRLPGLNWVEFQQRVRRDIPTFVLISEGFDPDLSRSFRPGEGFLLGRALDEEEVERLLLAIESRQEAGTRR